MNTIESVFITQKCRFWGTKQIFFKIFMFGFLLLLTTRSISGAESDLLVVRGSGEYPPNEMMVDGKLVGFHIDIINEVAGLLNLKVTFKSRNRAQ